MKPLLKLLSCLSIVALSYSCSGSDSVELIRVDSYAAGVEPLNDSLRDGVELWKHYCAADDEGLEQFWSDYSSSDAVKVFYPDVDERINTHIAEIGKELYDLKTSMAQKFPEISFPKKVYSIISPYSQSVMLSDSVMLIALNHYLGADYPGYKGLPDEQKILKTPQNIKLDVAEALLRSKYSFAGNEWSTALSKMVYEGAVAYAVKAATGCNLKEAIGTSEENLKLMRSNEKDIWKNLIEAQMIYSTAPRVADELIKPYPTRRFPPRVGRYLGYKIVESTPEMDFSYADLLSPKFYMSEDVLKWYK